MYSPPRQAADLIRYFPQSNGIETDSRWNDEDLRLSGHLGSANILD